MQIGGTIPDRTIVKGDRTSELVGVGTLTQTRFFLDQAFVVASSYSLRTGNDESEEGTALVENTHYTLEKDDGKITLLDAGTTIVDTANIYADYSYVTIALTDTQLQDALNRAQAEIDEDLNTHFANVSDATPDYTKISDEKHDGYGRYRRDYFLEKFPIPNVTTNLADDMAIGDQTITVDSTDGFPEEGVIGIGQNKITYTGKNSAGTAFTGATAVTIAGSVDEDVKPYVVEISTTARGSEPDFSILDENSDFDIDILTGRVHLFRDDLLLDVLTTSNPPRLAPNRFRASYIMGNDSIPSDITRLALMIASKDLLHTVVRKNHAGGQNEFNPSMIDVDEKWINETKERYGNVKITQV